MKSKPAGRTEVRKVRKVTGQRTPTWRESQDWRDKPCPRGGCGCNVMRWWRFCPGCGEQLPSLLDVKEDWRVRAYPIQVRCYPHDDAGGWALYSRHRDWGNAANRAYVEARNAHPGARVELVDSREAGT